MKGYTKRPYNYTPEGLARRRASVRAKRAGSMRALERFWLKVRPDAAGECWIWRGSTYPNGYGQFAMRTERGSGNRMQAHRVAWQLTHGIELTPNDHLCHSCDVRRCVNPAHLAAADHLVNMRDMIAKGRAWWQRPATRRINGQNAGRRAA